MNVKNEIKIKQNASAIVLELVDEINKGNFKGKKFTIYGNNFKYVEMLTKNIKNMIIKENIIKITFTKEVFSGEGKCRTVIIKNSDISSFSLKESDW